MFTILVIYQLCLAVMAVAQVTYGPGGSHEFCLRGQGIGMRVELRACNKYDKSFYWYRAVDSQRKTWLRNALYDACISVNAAPYSGLEVVLAKCPEPITMYDLERVYQGSSGANMLWEQSDSGIHSVFQYHGTDYCLDNSAGQLMNGNKIQVWECLPGNPNQLWMNTNWNVIDW